MIFLYALAWLWTLPQTLVGLILLPFYHPVVMDWQDGVLVVQCDHIAGFANTIGQTWGRIVFLLHDAREGHPEYFTHELRHVLQSDVLGPLWGPVYGAASLAAMVSGGDYYMDNWFEKDARRAAGEP